jgi:hypothetical protein
VDDGREDKNPWVKWFWADYESDAGLRSSSLAAQGLWMRMLSIMAKSKTIGMMLDGESKMESKTLAKLVGEKVLHIEALLKELKTHGVYSQDDDGVIFNRRMARDGQLSEIRAKAGRKGGRPKKQNESKIKSKTKAASASAYASASIFFEEGVWGGIRDDDMAAWSEAYPACDVLVELKKMAEWLKANPDKKKIRYRLFIVNWLARTQDRGGSGNISGKDRRDPDHPQVGASIQSGKDVFREQYEKNKAKEEP